jgi:aspartate ammonia-lyase
VLRLPYRTPVRTMSRTTLAGMSSPSVRSLILAPNSRAVRRDAIIAACQEIVDGAHADQFPTPRVHGGGGTTANMNVNEVVATRASAIAGTAVHPNDHVNASQSTNDSYPTAMALTVLELVGTPVAALHELAVAFDRPQRAQFAPPRAGRHCEPDEHGRCQVK